jgi:hypothetical protein
MKQGAKESSEILRESTACQETLEPLNPRILELF